VAASVLIVLAVSARLPEESRIGRLRFFSELRPSEASVSMSLPRCKIVGRLLGGMGY